MHRRRFLIGGSLALAGASVALSEWQRMGSMADYAAAVGASRAPLPPRAGILELLRFATLAPNGHNTQPWLFRAVGDRITILPDFTRRTPVVDPDDHHLFVSLGCAAENLALAAAVQGRQGAFRFEPAGNGSLVFGPGGAAVAEPALFDAIPRRQSTRADYDGGAVSAQDLRTLASAATAAGVHVVLITERSQLDRVRDLIVAGNSAQMADAAFMRELKQWLRFSPRQALASRDGLFSAASGNPPLPAWLGSRMFDLVFKADSENDKYARQMQTSAGVAIFSGEKSDAEHWTFVGRACQRFALQATALGLTHAFVNQPVEVASLRADLAALAGLPGRRPDIVMRFGHGPTLPYSPRRAPILLT